MACPKNFAKIVKAAHPQVILLVKFRCSFLSVLSVQSVQSVLSDLPVRQLCYLNIGSYIGWIDRYSVFVNSTTITTNIETAVLSTLCPVRTLCPVCTVRSALPVKRFGMKLEVVHARWKLSDQ